MSSAFTFGKRSLERLKGVHPDLVWLAREALRESSQDFTVIEGLRTVARQRELVAVGASQTMDSRHITGHAIDCAAWVGEVRWDAGLYYPIAAAFQRASKALSIPVRWGGCWLRLDTTDKTPNVLVAEYVASRRAAGRKAFVDMPHFELPQGVYP